MVENGRRLSISNEAYSPAPGDCLVDEELAAGLFSLPDLDTAYCQVHLEVARVIIQCDCVDSKNGQPIERCALSDSTSLFEASEFNRSCSLYRIRSGGGLHETRAGYSYICPDKQESSVVRYYPGGLRIWISLRLYECVGKGRCHC